MRARDRLASAAMLLVLTACGDKASPSATSASASPVSAASATREMDEIVARVASGAPVDPVEAKEKALRDAKSFGVLGVDDGAKDAPGLASGWSSIDRVVTIPNPVLGSTGSVTLRELATLPASSALEDQVRERVLPKLELCWAGALDKDPAGRARFQIGAVVGKDGAVRSVALNGEKPPATGVGACVAEAFQTARFTVRAEAIDTRLEILALFEPGPPAGASTGSASPGGGPTIAGKRIDAVEVADVEKALATAGCTDVKNEPKPKTKGARLIGATCAGKPVAITFVGKRGRGDELDVEEVTRLVKVAALHRDGVFFLAIEAEDKRAAEELLAKLVQNR